MRRRTFLSGMGLSTAVLGIGTACSSRGEDSLVLWNPQDNWRKTTAFWAENDEGYRAEHPHVHPSYVDIPYGQYEARYVAGFASSNQAPDIYMGQVSYYGGAHGIADTAPDDLQDLWDGGLNPVTAPNFKVDGRWAGYPVSSDLGLQIFLNREHLADEGLSEDGPGDFDELLEYALALTRRQGDRVTRNGLAVRYSGSPTGIVDKALPYIHAFGGRLYAEDHSTASGVFDGEGTVAGIQYLQDLVHTHRVASLELGSPDDTFAQGLSSMTLREGWYEGWLRLNAPSVDFVVASLPKGPVIQPKVSLLFNWALMVNARSPRRELAWDWMRSMADPAKDAALAEVEGYLPVWMSNFSTPLVTERADIGAVTQQMEDGPGPVYDAPFTNQIAITQGEAVEACLQGAPVAETLAESVGDTDDLLQRR